MNCKICDHISSPLFEKLILNKYQAQYFSCGSCGFLQTSEPVWLEEAYNSAITSLDIGLASRNLWLAEELPAIIDHCFPDSESSLDFAGGYGLLVRLMRDKGYNFFWQDDYCENIFAKFFTLKDANRNRFDMVTAFEVLEHFNRPMPEISRVLGFADNMIFSTELLPAPGELEQWWYLSTETGQHIAFYSENTLKFIAQKYQKYFYTNGHNLHLFSARPLLQEQVDAAFKKNASKLSLLERALRRLDRRKQPSTIVKKSLLQQDYKTIQKIISRT